MRGSASLEEEEERAELASSVPWTQRESRCPQAGKPALTRYAICQHLGLGLPSLQRREVSAV